MGRKLWAPGELLTSADVNAYLSNQVITVCTSGARPSSPVEGMTIYETDTDAFMVYTGSIWRPKAGPAVVVEKTTGLPATITSASWVSVQWSAARLATDSSMWAIGNPTRLVAPIPGWYAVEAIATWSSSSATGSAISIIKNGNSALRWRGNVIKGTHSGGDTQTAHAMVDLAAASYVEMNLISFTASGSLNAFDMGPAMSMRYVRPL